MEPTKALSLRGPIVGATARRWKGQVDREDLDQQAAFAALYYGRRANGATSTQYVRRCLRLTLDSYCARAISVLHDSKCGTEIAGHRGSLIELLPAGDSNAEEPVVDPPIPSGEPDQHDELEHQQVRAAVRTAVIEETAHRKHRHILRDVMLTGRPVASVARERGEDPDRIRISYHRVIQRLRARTDLRILIDGGSR